MSKNYSARIVGIAVRPLGKVIAFVGSSSKCYSSTLSIFTSTYYSAVLGCSSYGINIDCKFGKKDSVLSKNYSTRIVGIAVRPSGKVIAVVGSSGDLAIIATIEI